MFHNRLVRAALAAVLGLGPIDLASAQMVAQFATTADPVVTSDTTAYCDELAGKIAGLTRGAIPPAPEDVEALAREGERMCTHGQIRGGVMRLRRAMAILRHGED
jgi:hypothetical protein